MGNEAKDNSSKDLLNVNWTRKSHEVYNPASYMTMNRINSR